MTPLKNTLLENTSSPKDIMGGSRSEGSSGWGKIGKITVSSFGDNFWKFKGGSDDLPTSYHWLAGKRKVDNIPGDCWRVHGKLYNLAPFIHTHPGGADWIAVTQGTDITEAFESNHIIHVDRVEAVLGKYYVGEAVGPRNSPYQFREDGFYKTLKRRVAPILKEIGTGPTRKCLLLQDGLALSYLITGVLGAASGSLVLQMVAGLFLGMNGVGAHNFLHLRDNWRRFYFDLSPMGSTEFRVTHALSHHIFTNTIMDYEVTGFQPMLELLPSREKNLIQRYGSLLYSHLLYTQVMMQDMAKRAYLQVTGKISWRFENAIVLLQILVIVGLSQTIIEGLLCYFIIISTASYWMSIVGFNAAHHHPACFHDGDEPRKDPDFGLCQLDATLEKGDNFHQTDFAVLTTFGEHPLHHLFPSVCHSKLPKIKHIFQEVLQEFVEKSRVASQLELFIGTHRQYARTNGWSRQKQRDYPFGEY